MSLKLFPDKLLNIEGGAEFERFCTVAYRYDFQDPNISFVGTNGISQGGLDILGYRHADRKTTGVQCKNYKSSPTYGLVTSCINEVEAGPFKIDNLTITVAEAPKPDLLSETIQLSQERADKGLFTVNLDHFDNLRLKIREIDLTRLELMFPELFNREREQYTGDPSRIQNIQLRNFLQGLKPIGGHNRPRIEPSVLEFVAKLCARCPRELVAPNNVRYIDMPSSEDFRKLVVRELASEQYGSKPYRELTGLELKTHALVNKAERRAKLQVHIPFFSYNPHDIRLSAYVANFSTLYPRCQRTFWMDDVDLAFGDADASYRFLEFVEYDERSGVDNYGRLFSKLGIYDHLFRTVFPALIKQGIFRVHFTLWHQCDEVRKTLEKFGFIEVEPGETYSEWVCDTLPHI